MRLKINHKLFITLLFTSVAVATGMFLFMQWSFDRGFLNYVNSQELEQLDEFTEELTSYYAFEGDWEFLRNNDSLWRQLLRSLAPEGVQPEPPQRRDFYQRRFDPRERDRRPPPFRDGFRREPERRPPPRPPEERGGIAPRVVLFDAGKTKVIGGPREEREGLQLRPFSHSGEVVGYLALVPVAEISDAGDLLFIEQQTESFALVALIMVVLSLLISFPITSHLLRPIKELAAGTRKLNAGKFKSRIKVATKDELGQLSEDFNNLAMTLEKNEKARQQWVADISHELRTPLAGLRGEIEALQDGVREPSSQNLATVHGETMRLGRLVNDLYELSMSDLGALNYKKIEVDPVGILEGTMELFEKRFEQKGIDLGIVQPPTSSFSFMADPDRLQQLFTNLLENSLRYTDSPGRLEVRVELGRRSVSFNFMDSAPGVLPVQLPRLFDRLYRAEESRNRAKGGAGLGMAICKNIVEAHKGRIDASNSPHGGLWVKVELPL